MRSAENCARTCPELNLKPYDQLHGTKHQTVYFGSDTQSFAANETRQVRLPLLTQRDFQPQPWADVPFTECRNEYVEGLRGRRVIPSRTP